MYTVAPPPAPQVQPSDFNNCPPTFSAMTKKNCIGSSRKQRWSSTNHVYSTRGRACSAFEAGWEGGRLGSEEGQGGLVVRWCCCGLSLLLLKSTERKHKEGKLCLHYHPHFHRPEGSTRRAKNNKSDASHAKIGAALNVSEIKNT